MKVPTLPALEEFSSETLQAIGACGITRYTSTDDQSIDLRELALDTAAAMCEAVAARGNAIAQQLVEQGAEASLRRAIVKSGSVEGAKDLLWGFARINRPWEVRLFLERLERHFPISVPDPNQLELIPA